MTKVASKQSQNMALPAEMSEAIAIVRRLQKAGHDIEIQAAPQTDDAAGLAKWATDQVCTLQRQIDQANAVQGFFLLWLKENADHGDLLAAYEKAGIKPRTAQQRIQVARLLLRLESSKCETVSHLPFRRQLQLAQIGPEAIEALEADGTLEELATMPNQQYQALINERKAREQVERRLEKYQDEYRQDIHQKKIKETVLQGIPEAIQQARRFSALVGSMGMELSIRGQMVFDRTLAADQLHADQNIRAMQFRQSAAAQLAGVDSAIKALLDLREHITEQAGDITVNDIPGLHAIELDEALDNYRWMLDCHGERAEHIGVPEGRRVSRKKR